MTWSEFLYFASPTVFCWLSAAALVYFKRSRRLSGWLMVAGIIIFASFIIALWFGQQRPPLRTMGETRLWYSFFLAITGYLIYRRWSYRWMLSYSAIVATVFVCVNIFKSEIHATNLMPALQSYWFVPHVTVYILSYAILGAVTIASCYQLVKMCRGESDGELFRFMDNMVYIGFGLLILGLLMGAVWAKEAWGHYWSWDPKETWAFVTCAAYLVYIHMRLQRVAPRFTVWILPVAFVLLMITWIGVNYLPAAQGSIHTY